MTYLSIAARGVTAAAMVFAAAPAFADNYGSGSIALGGTTYTQNFDSLSSGVASSGLPLGWRVSETGANQNSTYSVGAGTSNTGDVYSFGSANSADRALGSLRSNNLFPSFGAVFSNATGSTITGLNIDYFGEQWRNGSNSLDSLVFQYSLTSTSISDNSAAWISVAALQFSSPITSPNGALNGNLGANRKELSTLLSGLSIASGSSFTFRWLDTDAAGNEDGLAVDDFSISAVTAAGAVPETATWGMMIVGFGLIGFALRRRPSVRVSYAA
jgi:hypothetical protein